MSKIITVSQIIILLDIDRRKQVKTLLKKDINIIRKYNEIDIKELKSLKFIGHKTFIFKGKGCRTYHLTKAGDIVVNLIKDAVSYEKLSFEFDKHLKEK